MKGQAAMEFLMTYGWAILMGVVVIGVLSTYGVFNYKSLVPSKCMGPSELPCVKKPVILTNDIQSKFSFYVRHPFPKDIILKSIWTSANNECGTITAKTVIDDVEEELEDKRIRSGASFTVNVYCSEGQSNIVKQNFILIYQNVQSSFNRTAEFEIIAKASSGSESELTWP